MYIKLILLSIIAATLISCSPDKSKQTISIHTGPVIISVTLKPHESIVFNSFDKYSRTYEFKNPTDHDTVIIRKVKLKRPSLWQYGNLLVLQTGPVLKTYSLLLIPGDTVSLKGVSNGAIAMSKSSGYQKFLDSLITIPKDFYWFDVQLQNKTLLSQGINFFLKNIETTFNHNETRISRLHLPTVRGYWLRKVNDNIKYTAIAHLLQNRQNPRSGVTDSLYKAIYANSHEILAIDAINNNAIKGAIVSYNAKKQNSNIDINDFWATAAEVDEQLEETTLYKDYLRYELAAKYMNEPREMAKIVQQLATVRSKSPFLDTLYKVAITLAETNVDYSRAKQKLKKIDNGRYTFIINEDNQTDIHETKSTRNLPAISLYDFAGSKSDFKHIVVTDKYKLTLIDFWASWCIPCIMEMPALKRAEEKMKDKPIQFVTISIDKDEDIGKWIIAAKQNRLYGRPNQYRLPEFKQSALTKLIHLRNIPRYILIDRQGNIIDDDFYRPSDEKFQKRLMRYLD